MGDLSKKFFSGVVYTGIAKYSGIIISIVVSAILARLISAEVFGVVAIATVFINFFSTLTTVGLSPAIVQNKELTDQDLRRINSFTFLIAALLSLVYLLSIPVIVSFYDDNKELKDVMYLLSINVFFSVATIVPNALILKDKLFKFISIRTLLVQLSLGVISVISAYCGLGIYALLINPIIGSIVLFFINFMKHPVGFAQLTRQSINKVFGFSVIQALFNFVYLVYRNIDKFFVGKYIGMAQLGYYEKSYRLMMLPLENVSSIISPVLHPLLSDYQNNQEMIWGVYLKMIKTLSEFVFILSVLLFFFAEPIILLLYGKNWEPSVPIFQILSLGICFQILQAPIGGVLQSINKVKGLLYGGLWMLVFVILALFGAYVTRDTNVLAIGLDVAFLLGFITYQCYLARYFNKKAISIFKLLFVDVALSCVLFIIVFAINKFISTPNIIIKMIVDGVVMLIFVAVLLFLGKLPNVKEMLFSLIKSFKHA